MDDTGNHTSVIYSVTACGVFLLLMYRNFRPWLSELRNLLRKPVLRHLVYPQAISHRYIGRWSRADILMQVIYVGVNVLCVCFKAPSLSSTGFRAANLSLINTVVLYATPHLGFLTNILGLKWTTIRRLHLTVGAVASLLLAFHVLVIAVSGHPFPLGKPENRGAVIVRLAPGIAAIGDVDNFTGSFGSWFSRAPFPPNPQEGILRGFSTLSPGVGNFVRVWSLDASASAATPSARI